MKKIAIAILLVATTSYARQPTSPYWGDLEPGRYVPGMKVMTFEDASRSFNKEGEKSAARRIEAVVFYPAGPAGEKQTFRQLIERTCPSADCTEKWEKSLGDYRKDLAPEKADALPATASSRSCGTACGGSGGQVL